MVGGNWKQNGTLKFASEFTQNVLSKIKFDQNKVEVVVAPTALHLLQARQGLSG